MVDAATRSAVESVFGMTKPEARDSGTAINRELARAESTPSAPFSIFNVQDAERAAKLASELGRLADAGGADKGLDDAVTEANRVAKTNPGLARHALGLFATHHPLGKTTPIPSLLKRTAVFAESAATTEAAEITLGSKSTGDEVKLDWFREDPLANEHHEHWHWVYPNFPQEGSALKQRHGELFYYMHQQMLARYDAERIAVSLPMVKPLTDFTTGVGEGYDPGLLDTGPDPQEAYEPRGADVGMEDQPEFTRALLKQYDERLATAAKTRKLQTGSSSVNLDGAAGSDLLGRAAEPASGAPPFYGWHHGMGHMLTAAASPNSLGVMRNPATAIRDPVFWRWHRRVDDIHFIYQDSLASQTFDDAPPVAIAQLDIVAEADGQAGAATSELTTQMRQGRYTLLDGKSYSFDYLSHDAFGVSVMLENSTAAAKTVTLRLFLIPHDLFAIDADPTTPAGRQMRRFVIELDKVKIDAPPGSSSHLRFGRDMSVIRRPAVVDPADVADIDGGNSPHATQECTCGWPYGLLLPRGTAAGMAFSVFAMVTDNALDRVGSQKACGSMSFCGVGQDYPDKRAMGYPFDRPLTQPLSALVAGHTNMKLAPLTIRWSNPPTS